MYNPLNLFGKRPSVTKETTPAAEQAHGLTARLAIRTAAFLALFGITSGAMWLSEQWVNNPLTSRLGARASRMSIMGAGVFLGGTVFLAISHMIRETQELTLQIPKERDAEGKVIFDTRKVTFASTPDAEKIMNDILAGHDEAVTIELPSDTVAKVTLARQIGEIRSLLGMGVTQAEVHANPTVDAVKAKLSEFDELTHDFDVAQKQGVAVAMMLGEIRDLMSMPVETDGAEIVSSARKLVEDHTAMNTVIVEITGNANGAGARELKRLHEKGAEGVALPDGFRYDAESQTLVYKSSAGVEIDTSFDTLKRAADIAAELKHEAGHDQLEVSHEGGSMFQIRTGADRTPLLDEKVRGREAAQRVLARLIVEQNRNRLGRFGEEGFAQRVNEIAIAVTMNKQVTNGQPAAAPAA